MNSFILTGKLTKMPETTPYGSRIIEIESSQPFRGTIGSFEPELYEIHITSSQEEYLKDSAQTGSRINVAGRIRSRAAKRGEKVFLNYSLSADLIEIAEPADE